MAFAYLDIETSWERSITIIGIYRQGHGTVQLIAPDITSAGLRQALDGVTRIFTYNGAGFDLPVIAQRIGVDLAREFEHRDLLWDCRKRKLKGGLKSVEKQLGIHRDTEGVDGLQAMKLWALHQGGHDRRCTADVDDPVLSAACCDALDLLLRYNREDCENLETLARKIGVLPPETPAVEPAQLTFNQVLRFERSA